MTDVDDCLFAWNDAFMEFANKFYPQYEPVIDAMAHWRIWDKFSNVSEEQSEEMLLHFNTSAKQAFMPPKWDSVEYVNRLIEEGWRYIAITSVSDDPDVYKLRKMCLDTLFPGGCIELHCLPLHGEKKDYLKQWQGKPYYWIEDKLKNAEAGHELGFKTILMDHPYNQNAPEGITRVNSWEQIYSILTSSQS
jgi:FMN phosphatase YigB (HAD superfamily)